MRTVVFLKSLRLENYNVFGSAHFNLATDVDHPLVLITGNNGAGKTSILEALRIALHGRRAFDAPVGETEYLRIMASHFKDGDRTSPCSINLEFEYVDHHITRHISLERTWAMRRQHIAETLSVTVDGNELPSDDAEDILATIVPTEVARYFFFDGERIRELAEWGIEEESALFQAVGELLGLGVLEQLKLDLGRLLDQDSKKTRGTEDLSSRLEESRGVVQTLNDQLKSARSEHRRLQSAWERARTAVRRLGILQKSELAEAQERLGSLEAERQHLQDDFHKAAHDILPLLFAKSLRKRFIKELNARLRLEEREIVSSFIDEHIPEIKTALRSRKIYAETAKVVIEEIARLARGKPMAVAPAFPHISRSDAAWMQRIVERELPELAERIRAMRKRLLELDKDIAKTKDRIRTSPSGDPAAEDALAALESCQAAVFEHEHKIAVLEKELTESKEVLEGLEHAIRMNRQEAFRSGRLAIRGQMMQNVLNALPVLTSRLEQSKEQRFSAYLKSALDDLWHKSDRLTEVLVSFSDRRIELLGPNGPIEKSELSAGEKQLFAVGFIYALAQLSGSRMPLVIDTPLGRLDREHRRRFVSGFLPTASHQVILLSTDTEIVGPLYDDIEPFLAHHYELASFNGGLTAPVQLALA
jgi:DNA sulfur modification protein DndD